MSLGLYVLEGHEPVAIADDEIDLWTAQLENRHELYAVGLTEVGKLIVSTIFLGIDYRFGYPGPPLLFETMVFGEGPVRQRRYATWAEAEAGHAETVAELRGLA